MAFPFITVSRSKGKSLGKSFPLPDFPFRFGDLIGPLVRVPREKIEIARRRQVPSNHFNTDCGENAGPARRICHRDF